MHRAGRPGARLFPHALAATIWVGGQLIPAALVTVLAALFLGVLLAG